MAKSGEAWTTDLKELNATRARFGLSPEADGLAAWEGADLLLVTAPVWFDLATCGETKRESSVRCRSTASSRRAFVSAIAAWSAKVWAARVIRRERLRLAPNDDYHGDEVVLEHDRHAEHRTEEPRPPWIGVFRVGQDFRDLDRPSFDGRAPGRRRPVESMPMLPVVLGARGFALLRAQVEEPLPS
jgi:hypothetical protein